VKTNAARILDKMGISYTIKTYAVDPTDLSAENVAAKVGMPPEQVFKTLVVRGDKTGVFMACVPGAAELDLKTLAAASGNKKVDMVALKEVQPLTGYIRGGVSPLGAKKRYPVYIDESARLWAEIAVSAGARGCQVVLNPADLMAVVEGKSAIISRTL